MLCPHALPYDNTDPTLPVFDSWGQVFRTNELADVRSIREATKQLTLWSGGKLNIRRATPESFRRVCNAVIVGADAGRLLKLRTEHPDWSIQELAKAASLRTEEIAALESSFANGSNGSSLWILGEDSAELHVTERTNGRAYTTSITW